MQPILAPDRYWADRVFGQIIRELQLAVVQKTPQLIPAAQGVVAIARFAQGAARERRCNSGFNPLHESRNDRLRFLSPQLEPFPGTQAGNLGVGFEFEELIDFRYDPRVSKSFLLSWTAWKK